MGERSGRIKTPQCRKGVPDERKRERGVGGGGEREGSIFRECEREKCLFGRKRKRRVGVCVCVYVCVRKRERERERERDSLSNL